MFKDLVAQLLTDNATTVSRVNKQVSYYCKISGSPILIDMELNLSAIDIIDLMEKGSIMAKSIKIINKEAITSTEDIDKNN